MKKTARQSGIELLRILTIMGVVLLHYNDGRAFVYAKDSPNLYVLYLLESLCICAVDLFVLISGYFLAGTQKRSYLKPVELIVQTILFKEAFYLATVVLGDGVFSIGSVVYKLIPANYFVILYTALYVISPYLNRIFADFTHKQWNRFLVVCILLFSVWPTVVDLTEEILGYEMIRDISTIGFKGSQQGFNIVNFTLMYFVGAYIRFNEFPKMLQKKWTQIVAIAVTVLLIFAWTLVTKDLTRFELRSAWVYHNTLVIFLAALLFQLFRSISFSSAFVNELAAATFTCFLFHGYLLSYVGIEKFATGNVFVMLVHILTVTTGCYLISYAVYKVYSLTTGWFFKILAEKIPFFQTREDV